MRRVVCAVLLLLWAGSASAVVKVVASMWPLALLVRDVGGDFVEVKTLLPPGASPHVWELRPRDVEAVSGCDLLVMVGCGAEPWLKVASQRRWLLCRGVALKEGNPHVWIGLKTVASRVESLAAELSRIDPSHRSYFFDRARRLKGKLEGLLELYRKRLSGLRVVSQHGAWVYLLSDLGVVYLGALEPSPHKEPGPRRFLMLADKLGGRCGVVVAEFGHNRALAERLARVSGSCMALLYPTGRGDEGSFCDFIRENLEPLVRCARRCIR